MIYMTNRNGFFKHVVPYLERKRKVSSSPNNLETIGEAGVQALSKATPKLTGETASSWGYTIEKTKGHTSIRWTNSVEAGSVPLAITLQYGHATRNGGYVEGTDYINPAMKPIFERLARSMRESMTG